MRAALLRFTASLPKPDKPISAIYLALALDLGGGASMTLTQCFRIAACSSADLPVRSQLIPSGATRFALAAGGGTVAPADSGFTTGTGSGAPGLTAPTLPSAFDAFICREN